MQTFEFVNFLSTFDWFEANNTSMLVSLGKKGLGRRILTTQNDFPRLGRDRVTVSLWATIPPSCVSARPPPTFASDLTIFSHWDLQQSCDFVGCNRKRVLVILI